MVGKPLRGMTQYELAKFWCDSWGVKPEADYIVKYSGASTHPRKGEFTGRFVKVSPRGHLVFRDGDTDVLMDLSMNATMRRASY